MHVQYIVGIYTHVCACDYVCECRLMLLLCVYVCVCGVCVCVVFVCVVCVCCVCVVCVVCVCITCTCFGDVHICSSHYWSTASIHTCI